MSFLARSLLKLLGIMIVVGLAVIFLPGSAADAQCDGTPGNDNINCTVDDNTEALLDTGNDTITVNAGVTVSGNNGIQQQGPSLTVNNQGSITGMGPISVGIITNGDVTITGNGTITGITGVSANGNVNNSSSGNITGTGPGGTGIIGNDVINSGSGNVSGSNSGISASGNITQSGTGTVSGAVGLQGLASDQTFTISNGTVTGTGGTAIYTDTGDDVVNITVGNAIINGTIDGDGQTTADTISFNGNATQAEVNAAQAFVGCNPCAGTLTAGGQSYTFLNFEAFINLLTVIAAGGGGGGQVVTVSFDSGSLAPSGPQVICDDGAVKVFHLPDGDVEVFSGFSSALPNGFLVGRVFSAQIPNVLRFQDRGPRNPGWYVGLTHQGGGSYIGQAYDQFNNPIGGGCHFDGPSSSSFVINANQQATGNSQQRISQLEAENAALEARIAELEALLNQ